jgi:hypothetical protein
MLGPPVCKKCMLVMGSITDKPYWSCSICKGTESKGLFTLTDDEVELMDKLHGTDWLELRKESQDTIPTETANARVTSPLG